MKRSVFTVILIISLLLSLVKSGVTPQGCNREVNITQVERIGEGVIINPETVAEDSNGFIYTGIHDGSILKINPTTLAITTYPFFLFFFFPFKMIIVVLYLVFIFLLKFY